ncbi:MAG: amino acid ABC transporter substrate-binding protein [Thermoproteus sp.]|nr:amino acid ABC transporter substrate-binding protein [Thermoproteus sp.]
MRAIAGIAIGLIIGLLVGLAIGYVAKPAAQQAGPPSTYTTTVTYTATAAPQGPVSVDAIKKRGYLLVGTDATWPPWEWIYNNTIVGWDIDIAREIAKALGVRLEVRDMRFAGIFQAVRDGRVDMVISATTWTAEREQAVDFSMPYYLESAVAVTLASRNDIRNVSDLYGKKVGVQVSTVEDDWATANLEKTGKAQVSRFDKVYPYMVEALRRGDVDAILIDRSIATALVTKFPDLKIAFEIPGSTGYIAIALPKCAQDLKLVVDQVIENLTQTGELQRIMQKNFELFLAASASPTS